MTKEEFNKLVVGAILLTGFFLLLFVGCTAVEKDKNANDVSRFVVIEQTYNFNVVYDKETKVMYAVSSGYYNDGNFTLLVDSEGKPLRWKGGR